MINWHEVEKAVREYQTVESEAKRGGIPIIDFLKWCRMKYKENKKKLVSLPHSRENSTSL